jgi:putative peptidoglycan lipid II flippase
MPALTIISGEDAGLDNHASAAAAATDVLDAESPLPSQPELVLRSAGVVSLAVALSRFSGLAREMVMAYAFGAGASHDAFLLGFRIPNLTRDLVGEGAFSSAFVPTFTRSLIGESDLPDKRHDAQELASQVISAILIIVGTACVFGMFLAPQLVGLLAPGFKVDPAKFELAVRLSRIMFPFLLLISLSSQATGMLNAQGSFGIPATASIFFNLGAIGGGLALGYWVGPAIHLNAVEGMAYGVVAGGALQLAWQLPRLRQMGYRFVPLWKWTHPGLRQLGKLMLPAFLASIAMQINLAVNTSFASRITDPIRGADGPVSWLAYALRFVQFPMGIFAVAMASAMLPSVSRSAASRNFNEFRTTLSRSLSVVFFLTLPSSLLLIVLGRAIIGSIYQSGHFQLYDTRQTATALGWYATGLVAFAAARILTPAYYALSDSRTPMYLAVLSIGANIAIPLFLLQVLHMNFAAMALTTSIAMSFEALCLYEGLRRKLGGLDGRYLMNRFARILGATLLTTAPLVLLDRQFESHFSAERAGYFLELIVLLPVAVLSFIAACRIFRVEEIRSASRFLSKAGSNLLARLAPLGG